MSTARFCIKHKVTTLLAVIMIAIFGVVFTTQLQMSLLPDMEAPMALVLCYYNGATPSDIEELVTRPLETAIMSVPGVDSVSSTSSDGVSQIQITYVEDTNLDIAASKLREKFDMLSLPDGAMDPIIVNMNISDLMPTAMIALMGDDLAELQELAEDVVVPALERIDGVASVSINGGVTEQITVEVDPTRAAGFGLSNSYISQFLTAENLLYPGGDVQNGSKTLTVSTDAKFQSVEDVANMIISLPTGGSVRLREVADVRLEATESDTLAMMNGEDMNSVQMEVEKKSNELNDKMDRLLTGFVTENFDNVLGPWVFLNACSMRFNGTPMTDAWVEEIMSRATPKFKNNQMVKDYYRKAQENERIMNGTEQDPNVQAPQLAPPTPRQMAQPTDSAAR